MEISADENDRDTGEEMDKGYNRPSELYDTVETTEIYTKSTVRFEVLGQVLPKMRSKSNKRRKNKCKEREENQEQIQLQPLLLKVSIDDMSSDHEATLAKIAQENPKVPKAKSTQEKKVHWGPKVIVEYSKKCTSGCAKDRNAEEQMLNISSQLDSLSDMPTDDKGKQRMKYWEEPVENSLSGEVETPPGYSDDTIPISLRDKGKPPIYTQSNDAGPSQKPEKYPYEVEFEDSIPDSMDAGLLDLFTGKQKPVYNQLFQAQLPLEILNDFISTFDRLIYTANEFVLRNWRTGYMTKLPGTEFPINVFDKAENEYMRVWKPRNAGKTWRQAAKDDEKLKTRGRTWKHSLLPRHWRAHGRLLREFEEPPDPSCKIRARTFCGKIECQWYVKCHSEKQFFRELFHNTVCGHGQCDENPDWRVGQPPVEHKSSLKQWVQVDPRAWDPPELDPTPIDRDDYAWNKEQNDPGVLEANEFPRWMIPWLYEGPPVKPIFQKCLAVSVITKCGLVNGRFLIFCNQHISGTGHCPGIEKYLLVLNKGCSPGKDNERCEVKNWCDEYIEYFRFQQKNPVLAEEEKQLLRKLINRLTLEYTNDLWNRYYPRHAKSAKAEEGFVGLVPNTLGYYEMLSLFSLKGIDPPSRPIR